MDSAAVAIDAPILGGNGSQRRAGPGCECRCGLGSGRGSDGRLREAAPVPFGEFRCARYCRGSSRDSTVCRDFIAGEEPGVLRLARR